MSEPNIAIYLDFENLSHSAEDAYPDIEKPLKIEPLLDYAAGRGNITIKRAYADWSKSIVRKYEKILVNHGFEMRHLPQTNSQGKNGADLQMTIDVLSDLQYLPVDIFILGSGDTDFIPLVRSINERGKQTHIVGFENSVGTAIKRNCTKFKTMEELLGFGEEEPDDFGDSRLSEELTSRMGRNLLIRFIKTHPGGEPILLAQLKMKLRRMDPSFSEKKLGFPSFKSFIHSYVGDIVAELYDDPKSGHPLALFRDFSEIDGKSNISEDEVTSLEIKNYVVRQLRYPKDRNIRLALCQKVLDIFQVKKSASMKEIIDFIADNIDFEYSKIAIRKFVYPLGGGGRVIQYENSNGDLSLLNRPQLLNDEIKTAEQIERAYLNRIHVLLEKKFSEIESDNLIRYLK